MTAQNSPAGAGNIQTFKVTSNKTGRTLDIADGAMEVTYYESVMSNNISATIVMVDTGTNVLENNQGVVDGLPIRGGELVDLVIEDSQPTPNQILFENTDLRVNRLRDIDPGTQQDVYMIDVSSNEFFFNEKKSVVRRYEGNISDSVISIIKDTLNSLQTLNIDKTSLPYNFFGNNRKPYHVLTDLASKAVPDRGIGGAAGFFFFQTRDSINFKSIDNMFSEKATKKFVYNNTGILPAGFDANILSYVINSDIEMDTNQRIGAYNTNTLYFDFLAMNYYETQFSISDQKSKGVTTAGQDYINVNKDLIDEPSRIFTKIHDIGSNPKGRGDNQLNYSFEKNYEADESLVQSPMRYNQLFSVRTDIIIEGDFSIRAGDIVECTFPQMSDDKNKESNTQSGGKYMCAHVAHKVNSDTTLTAITLIRDSFGTNSGLY